MARNFNGSSDFIDPGTHTWDPSTTGSVAFWVNFTSLPAASPGQGGIIATNDGLGGHNSIFFIRTDGKFGVDLNNNWGGSSSNPFTGSPTVLTGQYYHVGFTLAASSNSFGYLNGTSFGPADLGTSQTAISRPMTIGKDVFSRFINGTVAEIGIWNVILTPLEMAALAKGIRCYQIRPKALVAYWPFDGIQSPEPDLSGNAFNGTLTGTTQAFGPPIRMFTPLRPPGSDMPIFTATTVLYMHQIGANIGRRIVPVGY